MDLGRERNNLYTNDISLSLISKIQRTKACVFRWPGGGISSECKLLVDPASNKLIELWEVNEESGGRRERSSGVITRVFPSLSLFFFFVALRVPHVRVQDSVDGKGPLENKNMNKKRLLLCCSSYTAGFQGVSQVK